MSIVGYSACRIQFTSNNRQIPEHDYSDRSIIELRQNDITEYVLRAVDVENNKTEIFNLNLVDRDQYQFGRFQNQPDEITDFNGTYRLWLSVDSRSPFHETLHAVFEVLFPNELTDTSSEQLNESPNLSDSDEINEPDTPNPVNHNARDILTNIRNLSRYIKQGNDEEAARTATQLASQGIRLQAKSLTSLQNEEEFQILVQFDGTKYDINQHGETIPVDVFPSTTIRELRATFELAYHYLPVNQYFFVNGNLVHDNSTMKDLKVGLNSLFVLYLIFT